jgi:hypothetical protein
MGRTRSAFSSHTPQGSDWVGGRRDRRTTRVGCQGSTLTGFTADYDITCIIRRRSILG